MEPISHPLPEVDLSHPTFRRAVVREECIRLLKTALDEILSPESCKENRAKAIRWNDKSRAIRLFDGYLASSKVIKINPNEALIHSFSEYLGMQSGFENAKYRHAVSQSIRDLINHFPKSILRRSLIHERDTRDP